MGMVLTSCAVTGRPIVTGIETDEASFRLIPPFKGRIYCPHCQREHDWTKDQAWVAEKGPLSG
jgi:hypothetical protein